MDDSRHVTVLDQSDYDVGWSFARDWRLEGLPNGGLDGKDYALRRGIVREGLIAECSTCHLSLSAGDWVVILVSGYPQGRHYLETFFHFPKCLPSKYWLFSGDRRHLASTWRRRDLKWFQVSTTIGSVLKVTS